MRFASWYYHWFFLIQPAPLPERMIGGDPAFYLRWTLGGWGSNGIDFIEPEALAEYERCFCRADAIHAACEDYRASASIDLEHDRASRAAGEKVACDMLVLWGERGVVGRLFDPLATWRAQCAASGLRARRCRRATSSPKSCRTRRRRSCSRSCVAEQSVTRSASGRARARSTIAPLRRRSAHVPVDQPARSLLSDPLLGLGAVHGRLRGGHARLDAHGDARVAGDRLPRPGPGGACATCCRSATRSCATIR